MICSKCEKEYTLKDCYNKALEDIDTKNYSDLSARLDYLINFYPNKKDVIDLCDRIVKIIKRNNKDIDLCSLASKLEYAYPNKNASKGSINMAL